MPSAAQHKRGTSPGLIIGGRAIAAHIGVSRATLYRWIDKHGFPVGRSPGGMMMTTPALIAAWALSVPTNARRSETPHGRDIATRDASEGDRTAQGDRTGFP